LIGEHHRRQPVGVALRTIAAATRRRRTLLVFCLLDTYRSSADTLSMRTRIVFAVVLAAALVCSAAHAEQWLSLSKTSADRPTEIFIDMSSIVQKDEIRSVRTKYVALLPCPITHSHGAAFGIQRRSFDCNAGLVQVGGVELHSSDGASAGFLDVEQSWKPADGPLTKRMFDLVCAWKPTGSS
jgi:hypothetical protein